MNITSDVENNKLTATVTIPAADVDAAIKKAYKQAAKQYRFPGFRPGKAPRAVIDSALGAEAVLAQATNDILGSNEAALLNELDIVPLKEGDYSKVEAILRPTPPGLRLAALAELRRVHPSSHRRALQL